MSANKKQISDWPCSWEENELVQLRDGMHRPFRAKLEWIEAATEFARKLQAAPKTIPLPSDDEASSAPGRGRE